VSIKTINFTKARENLNAVLDGVVQDMSYTVITRRDKPAAVVMSLDYFNSMMETMHLLSTPANAAHLAKSIIQHQQGMVEEHDLLDA
jgi:antitoxin YefM